MRQLSHHEYQYELIEGGTGQGWGREGRQLKFGNQSIQLNVFISQRIFYSIVSLFSFKYQSLIIRTHTRSLPVIES